MMVHYSTWFAAKHKWETTNGREPNTLPCYRESFLLSDWSEGPLEATVYSPFRQGYQQAPPANPDRFRIVIKLNTANQMTFCRQLARYFGDMQDAALAVKPTNTDRIRARKPRGMPPTPVFRDLGSFIHYFSNKHDGWRDSDSNETGVHANVVRGSVRILVASNKQPHLQEPEWGTDYLYDGSKFLVLACLGIGSIYTASLEATALLIVPYGTRVSHWNISLKPDPRPIAVSLMMWLVRHDRARFISNVILHLIRLPFCVQVLIVKRLKASGSTLLGLSWLAITERARLKPDPRTTIGLLDRLLKLPANLQNLVIINALRLAQ